MSISTQCPEICPTSKAVLPRRSRRFGIGKEIGGAVYIHRRYEDLLGPSIEIGKRHIPRGFDYAIVKYAYRTGTMSFVSSPGFDGDPEPTAGDIWVIPECRPPRLIPAALDPFIYHHKWLMVADDYNGFDVEASKRRSIVWLSLSGVDKSRIGRRSYWAREVIPMMASRAADSCPDRTS